MDGTALFRERDRLPKRGTVFHPRNHHVMCSSECMYQNVSVNANPHCSSSSTLDPGHVPEETCYPGQTCKWGTLEVQDHLS